MSEHPALPDLPGAPVAADLVPLPRVAALALWASTSLRGEIGPDDALDAARGSGHRQEEHLGADLFDWLVEVRRLPLPQLRVVLPAPGRIAGLIGPPAAVTGAIAAGQALIVTAAGLTQHTLLPRTEVIGSAGARATIIRWDQVRAAGDPDRPAPTGTGREGFLRALRRAADASTGLDLVPEEPMELAHLPTGWTAVPLPTRLAAPVRHLLVLTARSLLLSEDELVRNAQGDGLGVSLAESVARERLLTELRDAAREALVETVGVA
ncbi:MAG: hypothetical protein Q4G40_10710, partial [Brachybacterium sp.]|nr:hypothetical protein [Brachybacterium sp.]